MSFLRLTWKRKRDEFQQGFVIGDPESIRDLYWQLTHNYKPQDGTAIGEILVSNLQGQPIDRKDLMTNPHSQTYPNSYFS